MKNFKEFAIITYKNRIVDNITTKSNSPEYLCLAKIEDLAYIILTGRAAPL